MRGEPSGLLIFGILFGGILGFIVIIAAISWLRTNLTGENLIRAARWVWGVAFPAVRSLVSEGRRSSRPAHLRPRPLRRADGRFNGSEVVTSVQPRSEGVTASERDVTERYQVANVTISVTEAAIIATRLAQGMAPSAVAKSLPGYTPRNYSEFMAKVQEVRATLAQALPAEPERREAAQPKLGVVEV